jgi:hypothetical protein
MRYYPLHSTSDRGLAEKAPWDMDRTGAEGAPSSNEPGRHIAETIAGPAAIMSLSTSAVSPSSLDLSIHPSIFVQFIKYTFHSSRRGASRRQCTVSIGSVEVCCNVRFANIETDLFNHSDKSSNAFLYLLTADEYIRVGTGCHCRYIY